MSCYKTQHTIELCYNGFVVFVLQVGPNYKEDKELILYPNKGGKVADILEEAAKVVEMSPDGSGRWVE